MGKIGFKTDFLSSIEELLKEDHIIQTRIPYIIELKSKEKRDF